MVARSALRGPVIRLAIPATKFDLLALVGYAPRMLRQMAEEALTIFRTPAVVVVLVIVAAIFVAFGGWILAMASVARAAKGALQDALFTAPSATS